MSVAQEKFSYVIPQEQQNQVTRKQKGLSRRAVVRGKFLLTGCIFVMFLTGVCIAYYYSQVAAVGYQITNLQGELARLQAEHEYLETQASQLVSLQKVEAIAITKLGMVKPDPKEVVLVAALPNIQNKESKISADSEIAPKAVDKPVQEKDKEYAGEKSPVIEAFVDMVSRWEKRI